MARNLLKTWGVRPEVHLAANQQQQRKNCKTPLGQSRYGTVARRREDRIVHAAALIDTVKEPVAVFVAFVGHAATADTRCDLSRIVGTLVETEAIVGSRAARTDRSIAVTVEEPAPGAKPVVTAVTVTSRTYAAAGNSQQQRHHE